MIVQKLGGTDWKYRDIQEKEWHDANVPGTLFMDMIREGRIQNPFYRFQEREFQELAQKDYEYELRFAVQEDVFFREKQFLVFEGIDTIADICLNGVEIAQTENMHRTYRLPVKGILQEGENLLHITLHSPVRYIEEQHRKHPLPEFNTASPHGFSQIRKIHSSFGWDAEPNVPDLGIWREVYIEAYDKARISHVYTRQRHEEGKVFLKTETLVDTVCGREADVSIILYDPEGTEISRKQTKCIEFLSEAWIEIENPQIWWPNGYGDQPLYEICVKMQCGEERDEKRFSVGLRTMEVRREKDAFGESFAFYVNGVPVFAKGGSYTPPDKFLTACRGQRHEELIRLCKEANYNCIRIWGGAVYPDDELYDLCDRNGILIWQDLMFACALYPSDEAFLESIREEVRDNVIRLRNHACLVLWCGNNENEWFHDYEHHAEGLTQELRMKNLQQYEVHLAEVVRKYDPDRLFWPSSPSSEGGYYDPNGYEKGDVHCWYVWYLPAKPYTFYRDCTGRFISEFGLESFQNYKTLCNYLDPEDMSPNSEVMDYMQRCSDNYCNMGNGKIMNYIFQEVQTPQSFKEYIFASQYAQAEGIKYGTCHFRSMKPRCMGALYWQIVDCFPGTSWSGIDYEYRLKVLHYYARRFFKQVILCVREDRFESRRLEILAVNDDPEGFASKLSWSLRDAAGHVVKNGEKTMQIPASSSTVIQEMDWSEEIKEEDRKKYYLELFLYGQNDEMIAEETYLFVKPKHFQFMHPEFMVDVQNQREKYILNIQTTCFAKCIKMDLEDNDCEFSDNCFDLSPGRTKTVEIDKKSLRRQITKEELKKQLIVENVNDIGKKL